MSAAAACGGVQARLQPPCSRTRQPVTRWQQPGRHPAAAPLRRRPTLLPPPRAAVQPQPPPGLAILPWTGTPEELAALEVLQQRMAASPYPETAQDAQTLTWFLRDRKLDVAEAEEKLLKMLRWRREFGADYITWADVAREAATGKAYLHSHPDVAGRPVIIVRAAKHVTDASNLADAQRLCVHLMDHALERLAADGAAAEAAGQPPVQTVLGIFDLRGFTSTNADWGFVRFLVDIFFLYYPKRLSQVLFVEAPWVFKPGWEIVKPWLKKYAALVRFVSADEVRAEYFTPDTVPDDFSGRFPK